MAVYTLYSNSSGVAGDTNASANSVVVRDNQGGVTHLAVTTAMLTNAGAEINSQTAIKTTNYTVASPSNGTGGDRIVLCNPTSAGFAVTLPLASFTPKQVLTIKNASGSTNAITIAAAGSDTIDGASTLVLNSAWGKATIQSDGGSKWYVIG